MIDRISQVQHFVKHHVLQRQRLPYRSEGFLVHQPHRTSTRRALCATAAVVGPFAREWVSCIPGVERAVRAADDVDEMHRAIVTVGLD